MKTVMLKLGIVAFLLAGGVTLVHNANSPASAAPQEFKTAVFAVS